MDDRELAQLSFIYSATTAYKLSPHQAHVVSCIGAALGINEVIGLISNTAALATAQGTLQILKFLAKRYLGWLGVAVAVYSFGNCMGGW